MTEEKIRVTIEFLGKNKKPATFDMALEDFHKKTLSEAFIDYTVNQLMKSAIPLTTKSTIPTEVKTNIGDVIKLPSREELEAFIRSQPEYEYSIDAINNHFLGDGLSSLSHKEFDKWDKGLRIKVKRIAQSIEDSEKGHWEGTHIGGHKKTFKFIRNSGDEIKNTKQRQTESEDKESVDSQSALFNF